MWLNSTIIVLLFLNQFVHSFFPRISTIFHRSIFYSNFDRIQDFIMPQDFTEENKLVIDTAGSLLDKISTKREGYENCYYQLGLLCREIKSDHKYNEEALHFFEYDINYNPKRDGTWYNIASILEEKGDTENAIIAYKNTIKVTENKQLVSASYNNIVGLLVQERRLDEAAMICNEAVNKDPSDALAWCNMGILLLENQSTEWAEKCFQNSLQCSNNTNTIALNNLGLICKESNRSDLSEYYYRQAISLDPYDTASMYALGMLLSEKRDTTSAIEMYQSCLAIDPNNVQAAFQLTILLQSNNYKNNNNNSNTPLSIPDQAPSEYISELFDYYASNGYDDHLLTNLEYRGAELLWDAFQTHILTANSSSSSDDNNSTTPYTILDMGCGTGIIAKKFQESWSTATSTSSTCIIVGCDISKNMVQLAKELTFVAPNQNKNHNTSSIVSSTDTSNNGVTSNHNENDDVISLTYQYVYEDVIVSDCVSFLSKSKDWDLVMAGDVLVYIGKLNELFVAAQTAIVEGGHLLFTVEKLSEVEVISNQEAHEEDIAKGYKLLDSGRYAHKKSYIESLAENTGFDVKHIDEVILRKENGFPVHGFVVVLKKRF